MTAPLVRRRNKLTKLLETQVSYWAEHAMYEGTARDVRFPLAICVCYQLTARIQIQYGEHWRITQIRRYIGTYRM